MKKALPIKSISSTTKEEFKLNHRNSPVIVKDGLIDHPCENITIDSLRSLFGDSKVLYSKALDGDNPRECTLSSFIENFFLADPHEGFGVRSFSSSNIPNLLDILPPPYFCEDWFDLHFSALWRSHIVSHSRHLWLFMSQKNTVSSFHQDHHNVHTTLMQTKGEKEVVLLSPDDSKKICKIKEDEIFKINKTPRGTFIEFNDPFLKTADEHGDIGCLQPFYGVLKKGEVLYLPAGWGHFVVATEASLTFSRDMIDDRNADDYFFTYIQEAASIFLELSKESKLEANY